MASVIWDAIVNQGELKLFMREQKAVSKWFQEYQEMLRPRLIPRDVDT
jgi:hypothetical protein